MPCFNAGSFNCLFFGHWNTWMQSFPGLVVQRQTPGRDWNFA